MRGKGQALAAQRWHRVPSGAWAGIHAVSADGEGSSLLTQREPAGSAVAAGARLGGDGGGNTGRQAAGGAHTGQLRQRLTLQQRRGQ
jgi:hypothetical protein